MIQTRIEHDLLGDRAVPAHAYWGVHTLRAVENFAISGQPIGQATEAVQARGDRAQAPPEKLRGLRQRGEACDARV